jgi:hypothetical protein
MSSAGYHSRILIALLPAALAIAGCAGNGNGLDANGNPLTPGGGGNTPLAPEFQSIQANVFTPICTRCHIGASAPEGLQLDADHSYALLVGVASAEQPSVLRVEAGDPDSSYIIRKLEGVSTISGGRMPLGGPYLDQATIDVIKQWITNGAQKGTASMSLEAAVKAVQRFGVASSSPDPDSIVSSQVPQIVVAFNGEIDSTLLNDNTVTLVRIVSTPAGAGSANPAAMNDGAIGAAPQPVPISTTVPRGNASAIVIKPRTPLTNGTYRVTLQSSLANINAQALGGDYSFTFTVDALQ